MGLGITALVAVRGQDPAALRPSPPADLPELPAPAGEPLVAPPPAPALPVRPALTVYNNSRIPALGGRAAARYRAGGWPVASVAGLTGRIRATTVYYGPGQRAQAETVAAAFGIPRVLPRFADLPGSGLTVVVTRDSA